MNQASYKLLRYIPDMARNEPVNIGVFAWYQDHAIIKFDSQAIDRAVTRDRELGDDVLQVITDEIAAEFDESPLRGEQEFLAFLQSTMKGPFVVTETRPFGLPDTPKTAIPRVLSNEVETLIDRLVKPVRRRSERPPKGPRHVLVEGYRRFLAPDQVITSYKMKHTETGLARTVDLFLNHNVDTAIDLIDLRRNSTRSAAIDATDAIKAKSQDILRGHEVKVVIAHLPADMRRELGAYVPTIQQMLKTEPNVHFTHTVAENVELVRRLAER